MPKLVPIVEGDGEVSAVPPLIRKVLWASARYDIQIARPKNANGRSNLTKRGGLERFVKYAWKEPDCGAIIILVDAESDCPLEIAKDFSRRILSMGVLFPVVIVVANRMFEAWFLASIDTIAGRLNFPSDVSGPSDPEAIRDPKAWIQRHFPLGRAYKETQDQEAMTSLLDLNLAKSARSFRRFLHAIEEAVIAMDASARQVTPHFDPRA